MTHKLLPILYSLVFLTIGSCTYTQKVKDGNFAFERKQYAVAINLLEKEYKKSKSKVEQGKIAFMLGESHKLLNRHDEASIWYKTAYDKAYGVDALKEYAYTLKAMEQYDDAMQAFKDLGIEIGSPYEYRREIAACQIAVGWKNEKSKPYKVELVEINSSNSDYSPAPYRNNQLVFTSDRPAATGENIYNWTGFDFSDLFVSNPKTGTVDKFSTNINSADNDGTVAFNGDYSELIFTRCYGNKKEDSYCKLLYSRFLGENWSVPQVLPFSQENVNYRHPALSPDGKTLFFSCNSKDGWGGYDIWTSTRGVGELEWSEPVLLGRSINSIGNEMFPSLDADTLYFASDWHPGMGGLDIFKTWKMPNGAWMPVQNLKPPVNSGADDFGFIVSKEESKSPDVIQIGYFSSNRAEGKGSDDIYRYERRIPPPEPQPEVPERIVYKFILEGFVLEKIFAEPGNPGSKILGRKALPNAEVATRFGNQLNQIIVGEDGKFTIELEENQSYSFLASKNGYLNGETTFSSVGLGKDPKNPVQIYEVEIVLDRIFLNQEIVLEDIYYDFDKWDIREDARPTLDKLARNLELNPQIKIQLASHTDCRGNDRYNLELSQRRAQSAVDYLITKGIDATRMTARGFGESQPKALCICQRCGEDEHQLNRRTTFTILE
jgi:outer membrane protein OmpA-like peptidoglycan-associated protein/tetratricopeptide (TPR) repeat protein